MRMKNRIALMCLMVGGLLALAAGCGKTEKAAPAIQEADNATSPAKAGPMPAPETRIAQKTNAVAATTNAAKTALDTTAKTVPPVKEAAAQAVDAVKSATDTVAKAVAPAKESVTQVVDVAKPATDTPQGAVAQAKTTLAGLSQDQMVKGLEDALAKALQQAIVRLGHDGGFLTNLNVKIPMPEKLQKVENVLRAMKQDKLADEFVTTMNHAAEQAVPEAGIVFGNALKQMTIQDAKSILSGPNDAATQYFQKMTQTNLYAKFYPIVQKATEKTGVTAAYKTFVEKANVSQGLGSFGNLVSSSLLGKDSLDIDAYVTTKAMEGLFKMVAQEEQQIRQNPVARTTDLLQKVFGALRK